MSEDLMLLEKSPSLLAIIAKMSYVKCLVVYCYCSVLFGKCTCVRVLRVKMSSCHSGTKIHYAKVDKEKGFLISYSPFYLRCYSTSDISVC